MIAFVLTLAFVIVATTGAYLYVTSQAYTKTLSDRDALRVRIMKDSISGKLAPGVGPKMLGKILEIDVSDHQWALIIHTDPWILYGPEIMKYRESLSENSAQSGDALLGNA